MYEPYYSVGRHFSADGWVHGAADVLRGKLNDADVAQAAAEALHMMARRRDWMRCWALFDVLPVLHYLSKVPSPSPPSLPLSLPLSLPFSILPL